MADDATRVDLELESETEEATLDLEGDTSQTLDLEVEDEVEECTLNLSDDTANYLDLEFENQIDVIKTGGGDAVYDGKLTITQGGVEKGTFSANSKNNVTIDVDAGSGDTVYDGTLTIQQGDDVKGTFSANASSDVTIKLDECKLPDCSGFHDSYLSVTKDDWPFWQNPNIEINTDITPEYDPLVTNNAVYNYVGTGKLSLVYGATEIGSFGANQQDSTEIALDEFAKLASPAFTGTPTAPTATAGDNTTQIATTAFVTDAINTAIVEVENGTY